MTDETPNRSGLAIPNQVLGEEARTIRRKGCIEGGGRRRRLSSNDCAPSGLWELTKPGTGFSKGYSLGSPEKAATNLLLDKKKAAAQVGAYEGLPYTVRTISQVRVFQM